MKISKKFKFLKIAILAAALQTLSFGFNAMAMEEKPVNIQQQSENISDGNMNIERNNINLNQQNQSVNENPMNLQQQSENINNSNMNIERNNINLNQQNQNINEQQPISMQQQSENINNDNMNIEENNIDLNQQDQDKKFDNFLADLEKQEKNTPETMKDFIINFFKKNPNATSKDAYLAFINLSNEKLQEIKKNTANENNRTSSTVSEKNYVMSEIVNEKVYNFYHKDLLSLQDEHFRKMVKIPKNHPKNIIFLSCSFGADEPGIEFDYESREAEWTRDKDGKLIPGPTHSKLHREENLNRKKVAPGKLTKDGKVRSSVLNPILMTKTANSILKKNETMEEENKVLLYIGVNPAGHVGYPNFDVDNGNAYLENVKPIESSYLYYVCPGKPVFFKNNENFFTNGSKQIGQLKHSNPYLMKMVHDVYTEEALKTGNSLNFIGLCVSNEDTTVMEDFGCKLYMQVDENTPLKTQKNSFKLATHINKYLKDTYALYIDENMKEEDMPKPCKAIRGEFWNVTHFTNAERNEYYKKAEKEGQINNALLSAFNNGLQNKPVRNKVVNDEKTTDAFGDAMACGIFDYIMDKNSKRKNK